ncbi:MAG: hypothetical protein ACYCXA_03125 [Actinomycetes bacterium]
MTENRDRPSRPAARSSTPGVPDVGTAAAQGVETIVCAVDGRWAVDIVVIFADGVARRRIGTYRTEALARIGATSIKRGAERDIGGPIHG